MGFSTSHTYVFVLSFSFFSFFKRPFDTATKLPATLTEIAMPLSGSSYIWSLHGHHKLAPIPWQEVAIKWFPKESLLQVNPPSHGAFLATWGFPENSTFNSFISPAFCGLFNLIK